MNFITFINKKEKRYYISKLSSGYNLGKNLSKREENDQLIKHKNTELYLQLYIPNDYKKEKDILKENNEKSIRKT